MTLFTPGRIGLRQIDFVTSEFSIGSSPRAIHVTPRCRTGHLELVVENGAGVTTIGEPCRYVRAWNFHNRWFAQSQCRPCNMPPRLNAYVPHDAVDKHAPPRRITLPRIHSAVGNRTPSDIAGLACAMLSEYMKRISLKEDGHD